MVCLQVAKATKKVVLNCADIEISSAQVVGGESEFWYTCNLVIIVLGMRGYCKIICMINCVCLVEIETVSILTSTIHCFYSLWRGLCSSNQSCPFVPLSLYGCSEVATFVS